MTVQRASTLVLLVTGCMGWTHAPAPPPPMASQASTPQDPPAAARLYYLLGMRAWLDGDSALARTEIAVALLLDPSSAWLHMTEGRIAAEQGDLGGARRLLEAALRLDPHLAQAREALETLDGDPSP